MRGYDRKKFIKYRIELYVTSKKKTSTISKKKMSVTNKKTKKVVI